MKLSVDELIGLAKTGKIVHLDGDRRHFTQIELDSMAKAVLHECLNMLEFEKDYYEREQKRIDKKRR